MHPENTTPTTSIGSDLAELRKRANKNQSEVAKSLGFDTSRISRIETGQIVPDLNEILRITSALGTTEAGEFGEYCQQKWSAPKPSFWHPSRHDLWQADQTFARLAPFSEKPGLTEAIKAQADLHRQALVGAVKFLTNREHAISFVGETGAGKSTAICGITGLLLPPDSKAAASLSKRVVLETGLANTTLCEVQLRSEGETTFGIVVHPHSDEEMFRTVGDFCIEISDTLAGRSGEPDGGGRGVSVEVNKALRNMAELARSKDKPSDPAIDLARQCNESDTEFTAEVLKRIRLDQRTKTEFRFDFSDHNAGLRHIRELSARINKGKESEVSLPRRIDVIVPLQLLGPSPFDIRVIDTKGVDGTAIRPDIRAYLDDARTVTVLCSRFANPPDSPLKLLMENLVATGAEKILAERVVLLVLPRTHEIAEMTDDAGEPVETVEYAYDIKRVQIQNYLAQISGAKGLPVHFLDVLGDDHRAVTGHLAAAIERLRKLHAHRIADVSQAVEQLISRHGEELTKKAQENVREWLRSFIGQHLTLQASPQALHEPLISQIRIAHPRIVWASTTRKGAYSGLNAYHFLGDGSAMSAQRRTQSVFSALVGLLGTMLGKPEFAPASDFLNELRQTIPTWRERFLHEVTTSGREIFRAELLDSSVWAECAKFYGDRAGAYRDRVAARLQDWCESHGHLAVATEKRVQAAWHDLVLKPLAALCDSGDLLADAGQSCPPGGIEEDAQ